MIEEGGVLFGLHHKTFPISPGLLSAIYLLYISSLYNISSGSRLKENLAAFINLRTPNAASCSTLPIRQYPIHLQWCSNLQSSSIVNLPTWLIITLSEQTPCSSGRRTEHDNPAHRKHPY